MQEATSPTVGLEVISSDGEILGVVKETKADRFKVDAPWRRDYWLDNADVQLVDAGAVGLTFPKGALDAHKRDEPGV